MCDSIQLVSIHFLMGKSEMVSKLDATMGEKKVSLRLRDPRSGTAHRLMEQFSGFQNIIIYDILRYLLGILTIVL